MRDLATAILGYGGQHQPRDPLLLSAAGIGNGVTTRQAAILNCPVSLPLTFPVHASRRRLKRSNKIRGRQLDELYDWFRPTKLTPRKLWSGLESFGIATSTIIASHLLIYACQLYTKDGLTLSLVQVSLVGIHIVHYLGSPLCAKGMQMPS